ncbi:putative importin 11 [Tothia fuscella]|uniref:Importin 11 n=1 Tax=Tothia fuscella TaxID=1048955 RepID=A0A9P4NZN7_9PEZI|nr:putative importin 11 [Tothia fuscella]
MMDPVELPGEANPLNRNRLIHNLQVGSHRSANNHELQTVTKQLQEWENQSEFYVLLQSISTDQSVPFEARYLAGLQLLHSVTNKQVWSRSASGTGINQSDKAKIRSNLLIAGYRDPDDRLARQNALLTAKIVRSDYPREWPNVFDDINATTSGAFDWQNPVHILQMRRALEFLRCIVKELAKASLKLANLRSKAPELLGPICEIFVGCSSRLPASIQNDSFSIDETNTIGLLLPSISVIRRLLVKGYLTPHRDADVSNAWTLILQFFVPRTQQLSSNEPAATNSSRLMLDKSLMQIAKLHLELAEENLTAFILLPHSLDLIKAYWEIIKNVGQTYGSDSTDSTQLGTDGDASDNATPLIEKLALQGFLILRACLRILSDPRSIKVRNEQDTAEKDEALRRLQVEIFTPSFIQEILELTISRFFVFRSSDLRRWEEEPDEWEAAEGGDTEGYRYSLRLTAEKLVLDLANKYTEAVVPNILHLVEASTPTQVPITQKESAYTALGLAADKVFVFSNKQNSQFDFNNIISNLVSDIQVQEPGYRLIRRRIAILLGKWVHIQVSKENRALLYQILLHLLDKNDPLNDLVVRVTAGRQFKELVADWEFDAEPFLPFAPEAISRIMNLIAEVDLPETKMGLLETISSFVENMSHHIGPFADRIVSILPALWDETGEETLRKQVIVTLLVNLFTSLGPASKQYQNFALFIIKAVISDQSTLLQLERMALLPDALDLWRAILENTPNTTVDQLHPTLLELLKTNLIPILSMDFEARRAALEITSSYFLLIPKEFLSEQTFVAELLQSQSIFLSNMKPDASAQVFEVVEQLIRAAEDFAGVEGVQIVAKAMITTGNNSSNFFAELLHGLHDAWEAHQTTGPKAKVSDVQGEVETDFFSVIARIVYASPELFVELLAVIMPNTSVEETMSWLLEEWFSHSQDMISEPSRQKLSTMALTRLFSTAQPFILSRLQPLIDLWISVIESLTEGNEDKSVDSLVYARPEGGCAYVASEGQSAGEARKSALAAGDPVHAVNLREFVKWAVGSAVEKVGGVEAFQENWLVNVDREVLEQFGKLGIL